MDSGKISGIGGVSCHEVVQGFDGVRFLRESKSKYGIGGRWG